MNYINPKKIAELIKAAKRLSGFGVLIFGISLFFYSFQTHSQDFTIRDCASISENPLPGYNCGFLGLPLCNAIPNASYVIDERYVLSPDEAKINRRNCADLSDLTLCSDINSTPISHRNCVDECNNLRFNNDSDPSNSTRGIDYAIHNRDCVRFSDDPEPNVIANSSNSIFRRCHQIDSPNPNTPNKNCDLLSCDLLTIDELAKDKFLEEAYNRISITEYIQKKYCDGEKATDGSPLKCYKFSRDKLPYMVVNTTCKIHDCPPSDSSNHCGISDDTVNIPSTPADYREIYRTNINGGYNLNGGSLCSPVTCRPLVTKYFSCTGTDNPPSTRNALCDTTSNCNNGYCSRQVNCNLNSNEDKDVCATSDISDDGTIGSNSDITNSWLYRPKPMDKSTILDQGAKRMRSIGNNLCYTKEAMKSYEWGTSSTTRSEAENVAVSILAPIFLIGYHHSYLSPDQTRSPGMCNTVRLGSRGTGYAHLCGNRGNLYSNVSEHTAYHKGYVSTTFADNGSSTHKLIVCLRFKNAMRPDDNGESETCGSRECGIHCAFSSCSQACGYDVCRELTVNDSSEEECMMTNDMFDNPNDNKGCAEVIDEYLRIRAVKYSGNKICTFLDVKGQLAYRNTLNFLDGSEKLNDGTCISGSLRGTTCENGKNSRNHPGSASKWRTIKLGNSQNIPYILNNQPNNNNINGYLDKDGQLFDEQECIKTPMKIRPPNLFNLANINNSPQLFSPPVYIKHSLTKRNSSVVSSLKTTTEIHGATDFHYPAIRIQFGAAEKDLSLGIGFTGYETETRNRDPLGRALVNTKIDQVDYTLEVFVRKEYDVTQSKPIFCLYRTFKGSDGEELEPMRIQCVNRTLPEIDHTETVGTSEILRKKMILSLEQGSTYNNSSIKIRYLVGSASGDTINCTNNSNQCSAPIVLKNDNVNIPTCASLIESYNLCVQREECSILTNECVFNDIEMHNNRKDNKSIDQNLVVKKQCEEKLKRCNEKKGITSENLDYSTSSADNHYGWFNEICITSGFETKLREIVAYRMADKTRGKCLVDNATCPEGGKAPDCRCRGYDSSVTLPSNQEHRFETPHEAGLCIEMPRPKVCNAINYSSTNNTNPNDPDFILTSLNRTTYGIGENDVTGVVHISHKRRMDGDSASIPLDQKTEPRTPGANQAEFGYAYHGMNDVEGTCKGFWQNAKSNAGLTTPPTRSCILNESGQAKWGVVTNPCRRYTCRSISSLGVNQNGFYQGDYGASEDTDLKGLSEGYAFWNFYTKTNDFLENTPPTAFNSCITGFRQKTASNPTRTCNQLGRWGIVAESNRCERIMCTAISGPDLNALPENMTLTQALEDWNNKKGATFTATPASRSSSSNLTLVESNAIGICREDFGFFSNGVNPRRYCNSSGTWSEVTNPCTSSCDIVTTLEESHGFAYWPEASTAAGDIKVRSSGCGNGYFKYPYPPLKNEDGIAFQISNNFNSRINGSTTTFTEIPLDVTKDGREVPQFATRTCRVQQTTYGNLTRRVWSNPSSECVNGCVSADKDRRIEAGKTRHLLSNGTTIYISWPDAAFGDTKYVFYPPETEASKHNASHYSRNRSNNYYALSRRCNPDTKKWDPAQPLCVAGSGVITDDDKSTSSTEDDISSNAKYTGVVKVNESTSSGQCVDGFEKTKTLNASNYTEIPIRNYTCVYPQQSFIDQVYFTRKTSDSGDICRKYCRKSSIPGTGTGNSTQHVYPGSLDYFSPGAKIILSCGSGYGKAIDSNRTNFDNNCGRDATDRTNLSPTVTCGADGSWGKVSNECSACRSCSGKGKLPTPKPETYKIFFEKKNQYSYGGQTKSCTTKLNCKTDCNAPTLNSGGVHICVLEGSCGPLKIMTEESETYTIKATCDMTCTDGELIFTNGICEGDCSN
jgi:hypothetical protein